MNDATTTRYIVSQLGVITEIVCRHHLPRLPRKENNFHLVYQKYFLK